MKTDKRKYNGGNRPGSGRNPVPDEEKKVPITFYIKRKCLEFKVQIQNLVDKINER